MPLILPFFAEASTATIVIDGVTYRVPLIDSDGHLQVDVLTSALPSGAATSARQDTMITALQLIDDLRGALDAVQTGRLNVNVYRDGASEAKSLRVVTGATSTTRLTAITPTSGKKIRFISVLAFTTSVTGTEIEVYFGTGATIGTDNTKAVFQPRLDLAQVPTHSQTWPDGGGPVGDADEVVSLRTGSNIGASAAIIVHYREE